MSKLKQKSSSKVLEWGNHSTSWKISKQKQKSSFKKFRTTQPSPLSKKNSKHEQNNKVPWNVWIWTWPPPPFGKIPNKSNFFLPMAFLTTDGQYLYHQVLVVSHPLVSNKIYSIMPLVARWVTTWKLQSFQEPNKGRIRGLITAILYKHCCGSNSPRDSSI